jgi:hypothetical protein
MAEYIVASFLQSSPPVTFKRSNWPLHITVLGLFMSQSSPAVLTNLLKEAMAQSSAIKTKGKSRELFGRNHDVSVTEAVKTPELSALQNRLWEAFAIHGEFRSPDFVGPNYRPHVTDTPSAIITPEQAILIESLSFVSLVGDTATILYTKKLSG